MECDKCKTELDDKSKFCRNCGKKTEEYIFNFDEGLKACSRFWFLAGYYKGLSFKDGDNKSITDFEALLKKSDIYEQYKEVITFLK